MLNEEFNNWEKDYTAKIRRWVPAYDQLIEHMTSLPEHFNPVNILDLGSGNGNAVALLLKKYPSAQFTLVDASEKMILATQERFKGQEDIFFKQVFFQGLSFLSDTFDLVTAGLAFHHLKAEEKQRFFEQLYRWMRPGACLSISDLFAAKSNPNYKEKIIKDWEEYAKKKGTSEEEWKNLMEHHDHFDFPDTLEDHITWLETVGFKNAKSTLINGKWGNLQVWK